MSSKLKRKKIGRIFPPYLFLFLAIILILPFNPSRAKEFDPEKYFHSEPWNSNGTMVTGSKGFKSAELEKEYLEANNYTLKLPDKIGNAIVNYAFWVARADNPYVYNPKLYKRIVLNKTSDSVTIMEGCFLEDITIPENSKLTRLSGLRGNYIKGLILSTSENFNSANYELGDNAAYYYEKGETPAESYEKKYSDIHWMRYIRDEEFDSSKKIYRRAKNTYLINPAAITVKYVDKEGKEIAPSQEIVGIGKVKAGIRIFNEKTLVNDYEVVEESKQKYLYNYNVVQDIKESKEFLDANPTKKFAVSFVGYVKDPVTGLSNKLFTYENYFLLDQTEPQKIKAKDIEGYNTPEAIEVDFYNRDDFKLDEKELVYRKEITFTYNKETEEKAVVSFTLGEGAAEGAIAPEAQKIKKGEKATKPTDPKAKEGYRFLGWYSGEGLYDFDSAVNSNLTLMGKFEKIPETVEHKVSFTLGEGAAEGVAAPEEQLVKDGEKATKPTDPLAKEEYTFSGWYNEGSVYEFDNPVKSALNLEAKFTKKAVDIYKVYFTVDGNVELIKDVEKGRSVNEPPKPTKAGHSFEGWYKGDELWNFAQVVLEDMTLRAQFKSEETPVTVDKSKLKAQYQLFKGEKKEDYQESTWEPFALALQKAKIILDLESVTQGEVDQSLTELMKAYKELRYKGPDAALTIKSIETLRNIEVGANTSENEAINRLPRTITIIDSKDQAHVLQLTWRIYNYDGKRDGNYNAKGTYYLPEIFATTARQRETFLDVVVRGNRGIPAIPVTPRHNAIYKDQFISFAPIDKIKIAIGENLVLPSTVKVNFSGNITRRIDVTWDKKNLDTNKIGNYTLWGTVTGIPQQVKIEIEVVEKKATQSIVNLGDISGHWAEKAISWTVKNNIFKGTAQGNFQPNRNITRGEFVTVLFRLAGQKEESYSKNSFTDINRGAYYAAPIEWARQKNIVTGYEDGSFIPEKNISREELATMMSRFINVMDFSFQGEVREEFKDINQTSTWARNDVKRMQILGLIQGKGHGNFAPKINTTRAEVAQILYNMDGKVLSRGTTSRDSTTVSNTTSSANTATRNNTGTILPGTSTGGTSTVTTNTNTPLPTPNPVTPGGGGTKQATVTVSIDVITILSNMKDLREGLESYVPADGWILQPITVNIQEGESAWEVLSRVASQHNIQIQHVYNEKYQSVYVQAINSLGEFDCGSLSGWMYNINGKYPDRGATIIKLRDGDRMEWRYTCNKEDGVGDHLDNLDNVGR